MGEVDHKSFVYYAQLQQCNKCKAGFTYEHEQNTNAACENEAIVECRCVTESKQTAFDCATNIRQTAEQYPSTVCTSKGICIQYIYVGFIRCLGEC